MWRKEAPCLSQTSSSPPTRPTRENPPAPAHLKASGKVSRNAVTHSLTARRPLVQPHQQSAFDALATGLRAEIQPWGALESDAFQQLLHAAWQLRLSDEYQAAIFSPTASPETHLQQLERLTRLRGALERSYQRAYRRLRELQATRAAESGLPVNAALDHSLSTPLAPLHAPPKQTHFYSEDTPQQWLSIFSNPEIYPLLPFRTVFLLHRVISSHPELAPAIPASAPQPSPETPTV